MLILRTSKVEIQNGIGTREKRERRGGFWDLKS